MVNENRTYHVLAKTTETLRKLLSNRLDDPEFRSFVPNEDAIVFLNPTESLRGADNRLSIWLYRIEENEFVKNQPPKLNRRTGEVEVPPLALDLSYLITPLTKEPISDQILLGRVMQIFYDNAIVPLHVQDLGIHEELHIVLDRMTLEEITRIWESLNEPYRLSTCYRVRVTRIASDRTLDTGKIEQADYNYADEVSHQSN